MATYVDASHNMLYTLDPKRWEADLVKSDKGDVTSYQEAAGRGARACLKAHCSVTGRGLYHPTRCGNPISWKTAVFEPVRVERRIVRGVVDSHLGAVAMGIDAKMNPARDFSYVGLKHIETGKTVLRINVHPLAGGTKPENHPENLDSVELSKYKDWGIGQYWLDVLSFTAGQMSLQDPGPTTMTNLWDIVSLGGDYNADLDGTERWYYPGSLLPALFVADEREMGIDHLQHGHGSDVKTKRRWVESGHTDHNLHFVERTIINVPDFPRQ